MASKLRSPPVRWLLASMFIFVCVQSQICKPLSVSPYPSCSKNCSQEKRFAGDNYFDCRIGNQRDWHKFQQDHWTIIDNYDSTIGSPKLMSVDFYMKCPNSSDPLLSFNISFALSKGRREPNRLLIAKGVHLEFGSIADINVHDSYYFQCPKDRIFDFHKYNPQFIDQEEEWQRVLWYDCIYGLNYTGGSKRKVYYLYLRSVPGTGVNYTLTTYHDKDESQWTLDAAGDIVTKKENAAGRVLYSESKDPKIWKPVIATAVNAEESTLHVVFEKAGDFHIQEYHIYLSAKPQNITEQSAKVKGSAAASLTFEKLYRGNYTVFVEGVLKDGTLCCQAESYDIQMPDTFPERPDSQAPVLYSGDALTLTIVAICVGSLLGVLLLTFTGCWLYSHKKRCEETFHGEKTHVLLLHMEENEGHEVVVAFKRFLEKVCHCIVHMDLEGLNNPDHDSQSVHTWVSEKLKLAKVVVVVCSYKLAKESSEESIRDSAVVSYSNFAVKALQHAIERRTRANDLRLLPVMFSYADNESFVPRILRQLKKMPTVLHLMSDVEKLFGDLYVEQDKRSWVGKEYFNATQEGANLRSAIIKAANTKQTTVTVEKTEGDKKDPGHKPAEESVKDHTSVDMDFTEKGAKPKTQIKLQQLPADSGKVSGDTVTKKRPRSDPQPAEKMSSYSGPEIHPHNPILYDQQFVSAPPMHHPPHIHSPVAHYNIPQFESYPVSYGDYGQARPVCRHKRFPHFHDPQPQFYSHPGEQVPVVPMATDIAGGHYRQPHTLPVVPLSFPDSVPSMVRNLPDHLHPLSQATFSLPHDFPSDEDDHLPEEQPLIGNKNIQNMMGGEMLQQRPGSFSQQEYSMLPTDFESFSPVGPDSPTESMCSDDINNELCALNDFHPPGM